MRERTDLDKKPTWYLFLFANVAVLLGCVVTWILLDRAYSEKTVFIPTVVCNLCALVACGFFIWLEAKDISLKVMHYQKKWLYFYLTALILFVASILFNATFFFCTTQNNDVLLNQLWAKIVYLVITGVLTLLAIGFQRYARYRIDLDIYRRKHGEEIKQQAEKKAKEEKTNKTKSSKPVKDSKVDKPTGGLLDKME